MGQPQTHRATTTALASPGPATSRDVHFYDTNVTSSSIPSLPSSSSASRGMLQELSADQVHNTSLAWNSPHRSQESQYLIALQDSKIVSLFKPKTSSSSRANRRRPGVDSDSFEPLDAVLEESSIASASSIAATFGSRSSGSQDISPKAKPAEIHPLITAKPASSARQQYENHLAATLLEPGEYSYLGLDFSQILSDNVKMSLAPPPAYEFHQTTPRKVPEVVEVVEQAVSPSLTLISERSSSYAGSSRNGSFSVPRIEDSLEELDKLEDELEAINAVTQPRRIGPLEAAPPSTKHLEPPSTIKKSSISKRASIAGMSATVRVKPSERPQPSIRRSTSLVFRDKKQGEPESTPQLRSRASRGKLPTFQPVPPKAPIKSTKPPTVPNFELPGEAVARRLKEQRQARLAQQTDAQKAYVPPPRPKSSKPPTKPSFELPGEAISRRKREEREARLKAQEEEERKKREFKARPVRTSITPSTIPRETITSLARQGKLPQEDDATKQPDIKSKRLSVAGARPVPTSENKAPQNRGRLSTATSREDLSRGTSTSGGSASGKRTTLTAEEAHQLRLRGKEIFQRDNSSFTRDREREKREREAAARTAREQAAERSRIASREWAEKRRRKEQALLKAAMG